MMEETCSAHQLTGNVVDGLTVMLRSRRKVVSSYVSCSPKYDGRRAVHTNVVDKLTSMLRSRRKAALQIAPQNMMEDVQCTPTSWMGSLRC
jgi:hypothetical protein